MAGAAPATIFAAATLLAAAALLANHPETDPQTISATPHVDGKE
jgi:hypothetical protein